MKVLHVITSLKTGGAEKLLVESVPLYVKKGIEVDVLLLDGTETIFSEQLRKNKTCNIYSVKTSMRNPFAIFYILPYLKKYDLIHVHLFPTLYWVIFASFFMKKSPKLVYTEHSTHNRRREKNFFKKIEKFIYNRYDRLICISEKTKANLSEWLDDKDSPRMKVIHNGINIQKFRDAISLDRTMFNIPSEARIILMTARFDVVKDQNSLIRAVSLLKDENIYLLLVGDGPLRQQSMELVAELDLAKNVMFLGIRGDIPELVKMADICVLSSNWEGFGLVAVEYMAGNKPVVVSNVEGLSNVVGGAGLLFEKGNAEDLKNKLLELLNNQDKYREVAQTCSERADLYDISLMVSSYISEYEMVLRNE